MPGLRTRFIRHIGLGVGVLMLLGATDEPPPVASALGALAAVIDSASVALGRLARP